MFGEELCRLRRSLHLTQRELGALCGLSASAIGMIEQGRRLPSVTRYSRLQTLFREHGAVLPPLPPVPQRTDWLYLLCGPGDQ